MLRKNKDVLVGGFVPQALADELTLYAMYKGESKAKIIRDYIVQLTEEGPGAEEMIKHIASQYIENWEKYEQELYQKSELTFDDFIGDVGVDLYNKGLARLYVVEIKKRLVEYEKKNS